MTKKFLILVVLVGLLFTQFPLSATRAKSFASPYELVEEVFKERIDLASSDDMETFIAKAENKKPLLSKNLLPPRAAVLPLKKPAPND